MGYFLKRQSTQTPKSNSKSSSNGNSNSGSDRQSSHLDDSLSNLEAQHEQQRQHEQLQYHPQCDKREKPSFRNLFFRRSDHATTATYSSSDGSVGLSSDGDDYDGKYCNYDRDLHHQGDENDKGADADDYCSHDQHHDQHHYYYDNSVYDGDDGDGSYEDPNSDLALMRQILEKIDEDPEFSKSIYAGCPRLQQLLDRHPDLRPIFHDPHLVKINFQQVYRQAGGKLPGDKDDSEKNGEEYDYEEEEDVDSKWCCLTRTKPSDNDSNDQQPKRRSPCIIWFINSPFFKVIKFLLLVKKVFNFVVGGGFAFIAGCCIGCCYEDALDDEAWDDDNGNEKDDDPNNSEGAGSESVASEHRQALEQAASYMEDPEVQDHLQEMLDNPDGLQESIERDPELRALRDGNPICGELIGSGDPEQLRILTDPDNLRALGEAPELVQADFMDPDGFVPSDDDGVFDANAMDDTERGFDIDGDGSYPGGDGLIENLPDIPDTNDGCGLGDFGAMDSTLEDEVETDGFIDLEGGEAGPDSAEVDTGFDGDIEVDGDGDAGADIGGDDNDGDEEEAWWEDVEIENDDEKDSNNIDRGNSNNRSDPTTANRNNKSQERKQQSRSNEGGGGSGFFASISAAATDFVVGQIVGSILDDDGVSMMQLENGGGELTGLEGIEKIAESSEDIVNEDVVEAVEEILDDCKDDKECDNTKGDAETVGASGIDGSRAVGDVDDKGYEEREETTEKERFGWVKSVGSAILTAATEQIATSVFGDDLGEELCERIEGDNDEKPKGSNLHAYSNLDNGDGAISSSRNDYH